MERRKVKKIIGMTGRRETDIPQLAINQHQDDEIAGLRADIKELKDILKPISETYRTVTSLGKWGMGLLVLLSVIIGIAIGIRNLFHR